MKTAIYIEDGVVQLVITPETAFEKNAIASLGTKEAKTTVFQGSFYDCRGGWVRQKAHYPMNEESDDSSLIIRTENPKCSA